MKRINVNWSCGERFKNLLSEAQFNLVATQRAAKLVVKALKAGDKTVTLVSEEEGEGGLTPEGKPADTRTEAQKRSLIDLIIALKKVFPKAVVKGHYQLCANIRKACPCFDAEREYQTIDGFAALFN